MVAADPPTTPSISVIVAEDSHGLRLDVFLASWGEFADEEDGLVGSPAAALSGLSRSRIRKLIEAGEVVVDGHPTRPAAKVRAGQTVGVRFPPPTATDLVPEPMDLDVLFEDRHIIVLNKAPGIVVHPGAGHTSGTLVHGLLAHCSDLSGIGGVERPGIVHRLDRGTSGVLVVAKTDHAHSHLSAQFAARRAAKSYVAFVLGVPEPVAATFDTFYGRHPKDRKKFSSRVTSGKRAVTHYETVASGCNVSELRVDIETGRTHQIRVHLKDAGYPILGDPTYGPRSLGKVASAALRDRVMELGRQALHAAKLELTHPATEERVTYGAPLPPDLVELQRILADEAVDG